ncbi:lactonase family protein [Streptomyces sp. NPDC090022]|uniref:lactonase family protein n=1 Tax=Streptomyces sp. NPDC090022 TaxID=3365920 RepID=UPI003801D024
MDEREIRAYVGSFTSAGGRGVTTAAVDPATGALRVLGASDAVADPSYLAVGERCVYAVSEGEAGVVAAFAPGADGVLRPAAAPASTHGRGPTHLATVGTSWLVAAHYTSGSVVALPLGPDGGPGQAASVLRHTGSGPDSDRQREPHAHQVLPDPTGRWVLSVDLGTDSVRVCALDGADGVLRPRGEAKLPPGNGPRHLAFHPGGELLYVLNELRPLLTVCRWDAASGEVEPVHEVPVAPEGAPGGARPYPSAVVVAPDGRFVWAAVRGSDTIAVLSLAGDPARPRLTATVASGGHWPRDLALEPAGGRLYLANERSGDVTWFDVDAETGVPRRAGSVAIPAATCVVFGPADRVRC